MKHYCRYCSHCVGQTDDWGICEIKNEEVSKTSIRNACTDFDFCEIDAFYYTRSDDPDNAKYKPRGPKTPRMKQCNGQISLFGKESGVNG